jgi:hypothetical protein
MRSVVIGQPRVVRIAIRLAHLYLTRMQPALPQPSFQRGENLWLVAQNKSPILFTIYMWIDEYTESRISGIPNPLELSSSGHGEYSGGCQDCWECVCKNGVRSLSWLNVFFPDRYYVPSGDHNGE